MNIVNIGCPGLGPSIEHFFFRIAGCIGKLSALLRKNFQRKEKRWEGRILITTLGFFFPTGFLTVNLRCEVDTENIGDIVKSCSPE